MRAPFSAGKNGKVPRWTEGLWASSGLHDKRFSSTTAGMEGVSKLIPKVCQKRLSGQPGMAAPSRSTWTCPRKSSLEELDIAGVDNLKSNQFFQDAAQQLAKGGDREGPCEPPPRARSLRGMFLSQE